MVLPILLITTCASGDSDRALSVFVATSLAGVLDEVAQDFTKETGIDVEVNVGPTPVLATQIREGASADLVVLPDKETLHALAEDSLLRPEQRIVATNRLEIVVEPGNPKKVTNLKDLDGESVKVALASPEVPVGRFARIAFAKAGVRVPDSTQEDSVQGVVSKVELGEVDAGVVYHSDAFSSSGVEGVAIPTEFNVSVGCWAGVSSTTSQGSAADRFLDYLVSVESKKVFAQHGFGDAESL